MEQTFIEYIKCVGINEYFGDKLIHLYCMKKRFINHKTQIQI